MMVAGVSLLHRAGVGTPLFLLHGVGSDALSWEPAFPDGRDIYAWNAPGYGDSAPLPDFAPRPADYAARLLDVLRLERIALVGHSLGALFAGAFAARYPARVASLGFLSPALGYRVPVGAPLPAGVQARIDDLDALGPEAFAERRAGRLLFRQDAVAGVKRAMAAVDPAGYAQAVRALGAGDLLADAARIDLPALVAIGAQDVVTLPRNARELHAALPHPGRLVIIPECGHAMAQEAPHAVRELLEDV